MAKDLASGRRFSRSCHLADSFHLRDRPCRLRQ